MALFVKYFITVFYLCYIAVAFVWPSLRTYKQTGVNPITFTNTDTAHDFIGKWFKVLFALMLAVIIIIWIDSGFYQYLLPVTYLDHLYVHWLGMFLCIVSLIWTVIAQQQMGKSWRIGIDQENKTELKTYGLFALSRNPIFLGMIITLIGFFLVLPNAVTLLVATVGYLFIQIQIRLEEDFLEQIHGEVYKIYKSNVPRFM